MERSNDHSPENGNDIPSVPAELEAKEDYEHKPEWSIKDFKGLVHIHSWEGSPCGKDTLLRLKRAFEKKTGLSYLALAEHIGWFEKFGGEHWHDKIESEFKTIDDLNAEDGKVQLIKGIEISVDADGSLDAPDELLGKADIVVASIHYDLQKEPASDLTGENTTQRWVKAMEEHSAINVLGHPLRSLPREEWDKVDWDAICETAKRYSVAIEIGIADNAPADLPQEFYDALARHGNMVSFSPDLHSVISHANSGLLTQDDQALLDRINQLKAGIESKGFSGKDKLKPKYDSLPQEEKEALRKTLKDEWQEHDIIEDSEALQKIYDVLTQNLPETIQHKNRNGEYVSKTIDKNPIPLKILLKYARRIYKAKQETTSGLSIDKRNIINLWDRQKFESWIAERKKIAHIREGLLNE